MPNPFIDPALLFQMEIPLRHWDGQWDSKGVRLPEIYQVPCFAEFSDREIFSDIRLGWNPNGLVIQVSVKGKRQTPWCRETRLDESDGFALPGKKGGRGKTDKASSHNHMYDIAHGML